MATTAEIARVFGNAIQQPKKRRRTTPAAKRQEIAAAQIAALEQAIAEIRRKAREMPAWAHGYNSAITTIELEIQRLGNS